MNVFDTHAQIITDYDRYIRSFVSISDPKIDAKVNEALSEGKLWPEPLLQFNPAFEQAGAVADLAGAGKLHSSLAHIFKGYSLYRHQVEAIQLGTSGQDFIVTSGTGSGKSLTYIGSIFHHLLNNPGAKGVAAIVVYPMNALINSQTEEFTRYRKNYESSTGQEFPITFGQYTGQEKEDQRKVMRDNPPQILLTNFMMLELLLTRTQERSIRDAIYQNLRFFVFDELHTYRGRQGADVAMLIRRIRTQCKQPVTCIGTSATMVSGGSKSEQRSQVDRVATTLFGKAFTADQVVNETLARSLDVAGGLAPRDILAAAIQATIQPEWDASTLRHHPVAVWLENCIALDELDGQLVRRKPLRIGEIVSMLSADSGVDLETCKRCLADTLLWISALNVRLQAAGQRYTFLPFKLHQFISQTGSVYTTLDQDDTRFITLEPGLYKPDDDNQKPIYPNVFSRASGQAFVCVSLVGNRLLPREFDDRESKDGGEEEEERAVHGYLIIGDDVWNDSELESLPDSWFRTNRSGRFPEANIVRRLPRLVYFDAWGHTADTPKSAIGKALEWRGWFMPVPLLFDPTSGVFFDTKVKESTKLTRLGSEGRSTSTTITAFSILKRLRQAGYHIKDQKLLSFTDNRQDAALQAGHFNDFVQVIQLRAGIRKALANAPDQALDFAQIGEAVFKALDLPFSEFTTRDEAPALASTRREYEETFQKFLLYRALADLRRSWRIVLPNLEQCGLLTIDYHGLDETATTDALWADMPLLSGMTHAMRHEFLGHVLDFFRLEYALHSVNFLEDSVMKQNEGYFREKLRSPWTLDRQEELRLPQVARLEPLSRKSHLPDVSMGPTSGLGKFIQQYLKDNDIDAKALKGDGYPAFVRKLMARLASADLLQPLKTKNEEEKETTVWRLKVDKIRWRLGDGQSVKVDVIKRRAYKRVVPQPNAFFRELYSLEFSDGKRLRAEDHTGQLNTDTRREREERFRAEWRTEDGQAWDDERIRREALSVLFCSPTMELGIDIGGLSVVHLRNAPPNPSNYTQRSGRAGRSGQGALIFTYCSSYSPHDRHYFQHQAELVAGTVQAPRLDLCNQELLLTHLNALAVSEIGLPGIEGQLDRPASLVTLLDKYAAGMPLSTAIRAGLELTPETLKRLKSIFTRVLLDLQPELTARAADWFTEGWVERNLLKLADHLDSAMGRWRKLHDSAKSLLSKASLQIQSGVLVVNGEEYKKAVRLQHQATRQLNLLENDLGSFSTELSEFYPYRYLAAEGFFPGYNFTRLPVRVFLDIRGASGEFISRARAIALREFGPRNIIYHNGRKYRVDQLVLQDADSSLTDAKVSLKAGYFLTGDQRNLEICPFSGYNLSDAANALHLSFLIEMGESRAIEVDRISCEEEERISKGYDIKTYFSVDGGHLERVRKAVARVEQTPLLNLRFIPAARLVHVNSQWRASKTQGFPMGLTTGFWHSSMPDPKDKKNKKDMPKEEPKLVRLHTSNTADALFIEPVQALGLAPSGVTTLQHALKRAIEMVFQVEPAEIGVVAVGSPEAPNILLYEASEGSLGILTQFADNSLVFQQVVEKAKDICRYDESTYLAPASYDDLLSYYNQRDHREINRFSIQDALEKLLVCTLELQTHTGYRDYDAHYQAMLAALDVNSRLEREFIDYLYQHALRLPDAAQRRAEGIYVQPDFFYAPDIHVFCDGGVHDRPDVMADDKKKRQALISQGWEVLVINHREDLAKKVTSRPDIFCRVR